MISPEMFEKFVLPDLESCCEQIDHDVVTQPKHKKTNMKKYIMDVHGFEEDNITVLMDDGKHQEPTKANMIAAYKKLVEDSKAGDAVFLHYSGTEKLSLVSVVYIF